MTTIPPRPPCRQTIYDDHTDRIRLCGAPSRFMDGNTPVCLLHGSHDFCATRQELSALGVTAPLTPADWHVLKKLLAGRQVVTPPPRITRLRKLLAAWVKDDRARGCIVAIPGTSAYRWHDGAFALAKIHHPDAGGSPDDFKRLRLAYEQGMKEHTP